VGELRRASVGLIVAVIVASAAVASQAIASRGAGASAAPAVRIGGPHKLHARRILKFPIFVSADSFVKVRGKLRLPGPNLPVRLSGTIRQGHPKQVKLTLNGPARRDLKANFRVSSMKIVVRARNLATNITHVARKTFRFKR
jgi:hypothetical protein